jgi:type I restriction enzyme S subunit
MTALLTDNLPLLAAAPNGVQKLRELVLELAIRGKLLEQNSNDEPASELLKRIAMEKALLIEQKVIRKGKPLPDIEKDEALFNLPIGWAWVRLGQIGDWGAGATPARGNSSYYGGEMPWFKSGELIADFIFESEENVTELALKECSLRRNKPGDVLIAMYGATIGKTAILSVAGTTNQAVCACTTFNGVFNRYLLLTLKALKSNFIGQGAGGAQPNISREKIVATVAGLPPLVEQHRIVSKVDELMVLCDRLEAQQADAKIAHSRLVQALLESLTLASDATDFAASWQRFAEHFHILFTTESSIDALKQTLLQLAVMGKLVRQDSSDEPAIELINRIRTDKQRFLANSKARRQKDLATDSLPVSPYEVPTGWEWQSIDDVLHVTGGITLGRKLGGRKLVSKPYLRVANVQRGRLEMDLIKEVDIPEDEVEKYLLRNGDLLITEGGDWDKVGRTAVWRDELPECLHQNHVFRARAVIADWEPRWAEMYLNSASAREYFAGSSKQTTNLASINMTQLRACAFPLPPLTEQHRIVAKVDQLMALCDQLKARLTQARRLNEQLTSTLVEQAVA